MRHLKNIITLLILVILSGVSLVATVKSIWIAWPAYDDAVLYDTVVEQDLTTWPPEDLRPFVKRLETRLDRGLDLEQLEGSLAEEQRSRFDQNMEILIASWLDWKVEKFAGLPGEERVAFLDRQIGRVRAWGLTTYLMPDLEESVSFSSAFQLMNRMQARLEKWTERVPPQRQEELRQFLIAAQSRLWAARWGEAGASRSN